MCSVNGIWPDFEEDQLLICPPRVEGFALNIKKWVYLDVGADVLRDLSEEQNSLELDPTVDAPFSKIVLPNNKTWQETKDVIKQLVKAHGSVMKDDDDVPGPFRDFIAGKGEGLVVLLYGTFRSMSVISLAD